MQVEKEPNGNYLVIKAATVADGGASRWSGSEQFPRRTHVWWSYPRTISSSLTRSTSQHTGCPPLLLQKIFKFYIFDHRTLRELFMQKIRFDGLILTKLEGVKK